MLVFLIEAGLERTCLCLVLSKLARTHSDSTEWQDRAREALKQTQELIRKTERPYEVHEPHWDDWEPDDYIGVFGERESVGYNRRSKAVEQLEQLLNDG